VKFFLVPRSRYLMQQARGRALERLCSSFKVTRRKWWWIFRESDASLRRRAIKVATEFRPHERILPKGVDTQAEQW
jgi:hypothetical protein